MKNERNRLTTFGIGALAAIAVLGWVRQPERHLPDESAGRATFQLPAGSVAAYPTPDFSGRAVASAPTRSLPDDAPVMEAAPVYRERQQVQVRRESPVARQPQSTVRQSEAPVSAPAAVEQPREANERDTTAVRTRPVEQDRDTGNRDIGSRDTEHRDTGHRDTEQSDVRVADRSDSTAQAARGRIQQRSTKQTAMIIAGSAAAGALIGGLSGGGKGAAIGAAAGGAGGYVYDRVTRRGSDTSSPASTNSSRDDRGDIGHQNDFVTRYATPGFAGR